MPENDKARRAGYQFGYRVVGPVLAGLILASVFVAACCVFGYLWGAL